MSELSKPGVECQSCINLVYATLSGFELMGKQLIEAHHETAAIHTELRNPTVLSWVMHSFIVGKWYVRYRYPWMKIPKSICDSIQLLLEDSNFFHNVGERDYQNLILLLLKSPEAVVKHVLSKGFDLHRRQCFKLLTDVGYDPNADRRNFYAVSRDLNGQASGRYTVLATHEPIDEQSKEPPEGLSLFWITILSKYFQEWATFSGQDCQRHIESLLRLGADPNQTIGPNSFIKEYRSTFPIVRSPGYTPIHFAVGDLDHNWSTSCYLQVPMSTEQTRRA